MTDILNLAQKLAAARVKLGSLKPDKTNKDQNYNYISADKILERAGDVLAEAGIVVVPSVMKVTMTLTERGNGKSPRIDAALDMTMQVSDGGEKDFIAYWTGCGSDYVTPDKAIYKAITSGHKYFLMKLLNVGVGNEDGERENEPAAQAQTQVWPPKDGGPKSSQQPDPAKVSEAEQEAPPAETEKVPFMTLDDARKYKTKDGEFYVNLPTEDLSHRYNNKLAPAKAREAARIIIDWRIANPE